MEVYVFSLNNVVLVNWSTYTPSMAGRFQEYRALLSHLQLVGPRVGQSLLKVLMLRGETRTSVI